MTFAEEIVEKRAFNHFTFLLFILMIIGLGWLALSGVPAGVTYITLGVIALMGILATFIITIDYPLRIPIEKTNLRSIWGFWIGVTFIVILAFFKDLFTSFQTFFNPLFLFNVRSAEATLPFNVLAAQSDTFFSWFSVVFGGAFEEIIFVGFFIVGIFLGVAIRKIARYDFGPAINRLTDIFWAALFVFIFFSVLHLFNSLYQSTSDFLIAGGFRILITILIFYIFGLSFGIGIHAANNAVFLGLPAAGAALLTIGGIIIAFILLLSIYSIILGFRESDNVLADIFDFRFQSDE